LINYNSKRELKNFLEEQGLGMPKKFGQNFMIDPSARSKLLDALGPQRGDKVWEVGPGLGAMTKGLLERGADLTAFEIDPAFARILRENFAGELFAGENIPGFRLIEGDVLKTWPSVQADDELFLFGNLPYNIGAALLADFIERGRLFRRIVVTVQREVARRMCAKPDSPDYSSFSVLCSSVYKVSPLFIIKPASFYPQPNVDSQGVKLDLLPVQQKRSGLFYPLVRGLFSSRRKTIRNSLSTFVTSVIIKGVSLSTRAESLPLRERVEGILNRAAINGDRRPETLAVDEFNALAVCVEEIISDGS